ncbi:polysaccharide deacetylase family protein [uncultured Clostridium sp.]|uniref:polysaccharide deacetylase family protein n=1 Tax=uncultured Clostridium sp. TaxID=59620 RepID=UPI0025D9F96A|nr:polysaccharide deacetylase family protein [uncultured Clostridium sp.]
MIKKNKNLYIVFIVLSVTLSVLMFYIAANKTIFNKSSNTNNTPSGNVSSDSLSVTDYEKNSSTAVQSRFIDTELTSKNIGVPVLYYHSVNKNAENEVTISPEMLEKQLDYINDNEYITITINELYDHLINNQPIPEKSIVITFDDGYMNNYTEAFPLLKERDMKATIFCVGNSLDGSYYLSKDAIKEMSDYGIDIESHTVNHMHLDTLNYDEQLSEMKNSKDILENITGKNVTAIAYPFGDFNDDSIKAAKEAGYKLAFTTHLGLSDRNDDIYALDRIYISSNYDMNTFKELIKNTSK